jgi:EmrB/QacA subfamily drug resistance transporter
MSQPDLPSRTPSVEAPAVPGTAPVNPFAQGKWLPYLPFLVAATFFMEYLDTTVLATALPQMAHSFGVLPNALSIGMSAYMLALAVFIPVSGWMADRFGSKTIFGTAIVVFTLASILCGLSVGIVSFTAARILQGIGGAMMVPVGRLIIVRAVDKANLMRAIATITWPAIAAPVVGPPIGGVITTYASWRWIFLLNVPFGIAALVAASIMIRNTRGVGRRPLDVLGFLYCALALTGIMYGTELASQQDANLGIAAACFFGGLLIGIVAVRHLRGHAHPLLNFSAMREPTFAVTVLSGSLTRIGINSVPFLLPLLFQVGFGLSAFHSGILLLVSALGNFGMKAITTKVLVRFGFRNTSLVDVAIGGIVIIACGFLTPQVPIAVTLIVIFVYGCTRSMQFSLLATLAYADIPKDQVSSANTLWNAALQMTLGLGIAFGALGLRLASALRSNDADTGVAGATPNAGHLVLSDFRLAFVGAGILTLMSLYGYWRLAPQAGRHLSKA